MLPTRVHGSSCLALTSHHITCDVSFLHTQTTDGMESLNVGVAGSILLYALHHHR